MQSNTVHRFRTTCGLGIAQQADWGSIWQVYWGSVRYSISGIWQEDWGSGWCIGDLEATGILGIWQVQ